MGNDGINKIIIDCRHLLSKYFNVIVCIDKHQLKYFDAAFQILLFIYIQIIYESTELQNSHKYEIFIYVCIFGYTSL